jgi:hypothetical protein
MSALALVALLPEPEDDAARMDFAMREFKTPDEVGDLLRELEERCPKWRVVTICHVEDLPVLMEPPEGAK